MIANKTDNLWGHEKEYAYFQKAIINNKLHHAWIISGDEGIGKTTFVYHLIRLILGTNESAIHRIKAGSHADLLVVGRRMDEKKQRLRSEILMDDIKAIGEFLRLTPAEGGWRIVVIKDADLMNRNAANSLLKLLEEPPKGALLFLITTNPNRLLPTILSRCRKMALHPLPPENIEKGLSILQPQLSSQDYQKIIPLSKGSLGKAIRLLETGNLDLKEIVEKLLNHSIKKQQFHQEIAIILQKDEGFTVFLNLLTDSILEKIKYAVQEGHPYIPPSARTIPEWIEVWQTLLKWHKETESFNLDKKQTLISEFNLVSEL